MAVKTQQKQRAKCLSVSKRNEDAWDLIDGYSLEWGVPYAQAIFRMAREYEQMKRWSIYNLGRTQR